MKMSEQIGLNSLGIKQYSVHNAIKAQQVLSLVLMAEVPLKKNCIGHHSFKFQSVCIWSIDLGYHRSLLREEIRKYLDTFMNLKI